jgi:uncharacterized RDD family membrane protein YckC
LLQIGQKNLTKNQKMDTLLDDVFNDKPRGQAVYATFWVRVAAVLVDTSLLLLVMMPLTYYNVISWKSMSALIAINGIGLVYKPLMEYKYGATLGKMLMRIIVVNYDFEKPSLMEVCIRNIINVISSVVSLGMTLYLFSLPESKDITGFLDYQQLLGKMTVSTNFNNLISLAYLIDVLMLFSDKHLRTYHDKLGKTYVVKQDSLRKNSI